MILVQLLILLKASLSLSAVHSYTGYRVVHVGAIETEDLTLIQGIIKLSRQQVMLMDDVILPATGVTLLVSPVALTDVLRILYTAGFNFTIVNRNYQQTLDKIETLNKKALQRIYEQQLVGLDFDHSAYLQYNEQLNWLYTMSNFASWTSLHEVTDWPTYEGQSIYVFAVNDGESSRPAVWLDANAHAMEWLTSATALYIIDKLSRGTTTEMIYLRNNFRFYIAPNINPDGYVYTWTRDRLWRKNRSIATNSSNNCVGVDINSNFNVGFGGADSSNDCTLDNYHGPTSFSEQESNAVRHFVNSVSPNVALFISLHAYKQYWLLPWAYTSTKTSDYTELLRVAEKAVLAVNKTNNSSFVSGTRADLNATPASGTSTDWARQDASVSYSYQVYSRPVATDPDGYVTAPANIVPSGAEILNGIVAACQAIFGFTHNQQQQQQQHQDAL